jgi:hypothetical protein
MQRIAAAAKYSSKVHTAKYSSKLHSKSSQQQSFCHTAKFTAANLHSQNNLNSVLSLIIMHSQSYSCRQQFFYEFQQLQQFLWFTELHMIEAKRCLQYGDTTSDKTREELNGGTQH